MSPRFDLVDIVKTLQQKARYIIIITIVAGVLGIVLRYLSKKEYEAKADFFVANPLYTDRTNIFRADGSLLIDYFAKEDDIDKVMAISKSDTMRKKVIEHLQLDKVYGKDMRKPMERMKLMELVEGLTEVKRTENSTIEIRYTDHNPELAAAVANDIVGTITSIFDNYYAGIRGHVQLSLQSKVSELDSAINSMTDTLAALRDQYKLYDIVSPSRRTIMSANIHGGGPGFGKGLEQIQNVESIKDQLVTDRAQYVSVLGEFTAGTKAGTMPIIQVLNKADVPAKRKGFGLLLTGVICAVIGGFFYSLWVLLVAYFRNILSTPR